MKFQEIKQIGHIVSFSFGVAKIQGLPNVFVNEVLVDEEGRESALVLGFDEIFVEALFFDLHFDIKKPVFRSNKVFSIPVSSDYIGRIIDGMGRPLDGLGNLSGEFRSVFGDAPSIIDRQPISVPLNTGIKIIDTNLPLGRGQRELIIGDRKLGKSTLATDIVLNQKDAEPPVYCIYVLCGQKKQKLYDLVRVFRKHNAFLYSTIVVANSDSSFAEQYLAPFIGCTIGEYFRDQGRDALVVYDDFSKHAKVYRDISLILNRPPGRETYPGDIFSLHAGLLERAANLSSQKGGGSLTALPIIETQEGDITSFIPTNLISITDGQIYLESGLFQKGFIPAVNVGLSVSRVGSQVQPKILKEVVGGIRLALAQHKELQKLSQLETVVSSESKKRIKRGNLILEMLKQFKHVNISWPEQVILFYSLEEGLFDDLKIEVWLKFEELLLEFIKSRHLALIYKIKSGIFDEEVKKELVGIVNNFKNEFFKKVL